jgi:DNA invertase Pin-like site-specific DNA recombinase
MMHTVLAANNEYQSRNMGDEIRRKVLVKIKEGGTHGPARLGYKNVGEGGKRWIALDPEAAELIRWCFTAYATGGWSVKNLLAEATARGLLSRGGPNTPRKPLSISQMHRILACPYYKGIVVFNGVEYQGKHESLIDAETWQRVQEEL